MLMATEWTLLEGCLIASISLQKQGKCVKRGECSHLWRIQQEDLLRPSPPPGPVFVAECCHEAILGVCTRLISS
jgi:hypothetical protein